VFWCGDFNYRVQNDYEQVKRLLAEGLREEVLLCDELTMQRREGNVFAGFEEGAINFNPTYKFDKWSNAYDTSPKRRVPSWTDRQKKNSQKSMYTDLT
jgi:phosphatidylinositol-bisphosphatase